MSRNIFEISQEHLYLINQLENSIEENNAPDDKIVAELEANEKDLHNKLKAYYHVINMRKADIQLIEDETKRLKDKKDTLNNIIDRLKKLVNQAVKQYGEQTKTGNYKLKMDTLSISSIFNKPVVVNDDFNNSNYMKYSINISSLNSKDKQKIEDLLKLKLVDFKEASVLDKVKLKEDLLAGNKVEGAKIDEEASYVKFT